MKRNFAILCTVMWMCAPFGAFAQDAAGDEEPKVAGDSDIGLKIGTVDPEEEKEKTRRRRPKVRDGSWLQKDEPIPDTPEVRSRYEAFLEAELRKHYARLAVLDRIIEVAVERDKDSLAARADAVRRKEVARFRKAMTEFRTQTQARRVVGFP